MPPLSQCIITCKLLQVRLAELPEGAASADVSTALLGLHAGRAHKLSLDPLNPTHCFYSCGEDGQVRFRSLMKKPKESYIKPFFS